MSLTRFLVSWLAVSAVAAPLIGRALADRSRAYPTPDANREAHDV